jgi:hypothetical protein
LHELLLALQVDLPFADFLAFLPAFAGAASLAGAAVLSVDAAPPVVSAAKAIPDIRPARAAAAKNDEPILLFIWFFS